MTDLELAYEECRMITRREARNFYYAFLTLPAAQRRAIYVAYTFCRNCDDSVDGASSLDEKLAMVSNLRRKLDQSYHDHPEDLVFLGLADVAQKYDIPQEYFQEVLSGVESDLIKNRYQNFDELRHYCYRVASAVGLIAIHIFGFNDPRARDHAVDLGLAMQLTNIARDVKEDLDFGRIYLPQDELTQFDYSEADLRAGVVNEPFKDLMRFQAQRAREYFDRGFKLLPYLPHRSRACPAVLGQLYSKVLDRIEAAEYDVLHHRVSLSKAEKVRVTAQTWLTSMLPWPRQNPA
jgi:phytoene synthase